MIWVTCWIVYLLWWPPSLCSVILPSRARSKYCLLGASICWKWDSYSQPRDRQTETIIVRDKMITLHITTNLMQVLFVSC